VIDRAKVATIAEIAEKDYTLSVNTFIEKTQQKAADPAEVRKKYFAAVQAVIEAENQLKELLRKEGLLDE